MVLEYDFAIMKKIKYWTFFLFLMFLCAQTSAQRRLFDRTDSFYPAVASRRQHNVTLPCHSSFLSSESMTSTNTAGPLMDKESQQVFHTQNGTEYEFKLHLVDIHSVRIQTFTSDQAHLSPQTGVFLSLNSLSSYWNRTWFNFECELTEKLASTSSHQKRVAMLMPTDEDLDSLLNPHGDLQKFIFFPKGRRHLRVAFNSSTRLYWYALTNAQSPIPNTFECNQTKVFSSVKYSKSINRLKEKTVFVENRNLTLWSVVWHLSELKVENVGFYYCVFMTKRHGRVTGYYVEVLSEQNYITFESDISLSRPYYARLKEHFSLRLSSAHKYPGTLNGTLSVKGTYAMVFYPKPISPDHLFANYLFQFYNVVFDNAGMYTMIVNQTFVPKLPPPAPEFTVATYSVYVFVLVPPQPRIYHRDNFYKGQNYSLECPSYSSNVDSFEWFRSPCGITCDLKEANWTLIEPNDRTKESVGIENTFDEFASPNREDFSDLVLMLNPVSQIQTRKQK